MAEEVSRVVVGLVGWKWLAGCNLTGVCYDPKVSAPPAVTLRMGILVIVGK